MKASRRSRTILAAAGSIMVLATVGLGAQGTWTLGTRTDAEKQNERPAALAAVRRLAAAIQSGMAGVVGVKNGSILLLDPSSRTLSDDVPVSPQGNRMFDVAITPDGRTALASELAAQRIWFINISRPSSPVILGSVPLSFMPEDIALTPDGKYALVTDSLFSNLIASIHVPSRTLVGEFNAGSTVSSVAVARDGRTVLCADFIWQQVNVLTLDPTNGHVAYRSTIPIPIPLLMNVTVSPDGRTALVAAINGCGVLRIDGPGNVTFMGSLPISGFWIGQSVAFEPKGARAYLLASDMNAANSSQFLVHVIAIQGPGQASLDGAPIPINGFSGNSAFFGVDTLAVEPLGRYLFVSNRGDDFLNRLAVVDLSSRTHFMDIDPASSGGSYPSGIAFAEGAADLAVSKTVDNDRPFTGETIAFTVTVVNRGPGIAYAVEAGDRLEAPLSLVSAEATSGSYDPESGSWTIGRLDPGRSATLVIRASVDGAVPFVNTARVTRQSNYDPQAGNNSASVSGEAIEPRPLPPASLLLQRLLSDFIFYHEYTNRLSWQANAGERTIIDHHNVYRKPKGGDDAQYVLVYTAAASVLSYDDRGLRAEQLFTYKVTSVDTMGHESDPAVAGN